MLDMFCGREGKTLYEIVQKWSNRKVEMSQDKGIREPEDDASKISFPVIGSWIIDKQQVTACLVDVNF